MTMKQVKHWQDPVNAAAGVWLIVSPWVLGFQGNTAAMWTMVATGILLGAVALGATFVPKQWEEWTEGALAVWLAASPWVLGFSKVEVPMVNAVLVAAVILVLALWVLVTDKDYLGGMTDRPAH
jgi:peptidoglycan/LPS O-acetylase OafA/YrhL